MDFFSSINTSSGGKFIKLKEAGDSIAGILTNVTLRQGTTFTANNAPIPNSEVNEDGSPRWRMLLEFDAEHEGNAEYGDETRKFELSKNRMEQVVAKAVMDATGKKQMVLPAEFKMVHNGKVNLKAGKTMNDFTVEFTPLPDAKPVILTPPTTPEPEAADSTSAESVF